MPRRLSLLRNSRIEICAGILIAITAIAQEKQDPKHLSREIATRGAKVVASELWNDPGGLLRVTNHIAGADPEWIKVGVSLYLASDGAIGESYGFALARILDTKPVVLLRVAVIKSKKHQELELSDVCGNFGYEESKKNVLAVIEKRLKILQTVDDASLQEKKSVCIKEIENLKGRIPEMFGTHSDKDGR
ncbi:MAG: hypothetical protein HY074_03130 [Deltaproteobacteria bacterium]|nr:hypothetical protein [Deltaproteobacteria bacterium]